MRKVTKFKNLPSLTLIPSSQRQALANQLKNDSSITQINSTITELQQNITANQEIANRYDLLMKGDVAKISEALTLRNWLIT